MGRADGAQGNIMAYESFSALNRILESAERKKKADQMQSLQMMQLAMGLKQYEEQKILESERYEDQLAHQVDLREHSQFLERERLKAANRERDHRDRVFDLEEKKANRQLDLAEWEHAQKKLSGLDMMNISKGTDIADRFLSNIGLTFSDDPNWQSEMKKVLMHKTRGLGMTDAQATRLVQSSVASSAGNFQRTLDIMKDINYAVGVFNAVQAKEVDPKEFSKEMSSLVDVYGKLGFFIPADDGSLQMIDKWDTLFEHSETVLQNRSNISTEMGELLKDDDTEIKLDIETFHYQAIEEAIKALDAAKATDDIDNLMDLWNEEEKVIPINSLNDKIDELQELQNRTMMGWDVGRSPQSIESEIGGLASELRDIQLKEIYLNDIPTDVSIVKALDELDLPATETNIDLMRGQMSYDRDYEEAPGLGF